MNIKDNFKNLMEKARGMSRKQISTWRYSLIFAICVDIFGVFWFLHQKKIGIALMVVFLIGLGFIMFLESKLPEEVKEKPTKEIKNKKEDKKMKTEEKETAGTGDSEDSNDFGFEMGLPSSEDFNKRMDDAFEFKGL